MIKRLIALIGFVFCLFAIPFLVNFSGLSSTQLTQAFLILLLLLLAIVTSFYLIVSGDEK